MKTSCITAPAKDPYIQLNRWHVNFCEGNHCAALLLSFLIAWHDWKLNHDHYYRRVNDIAEMHGDDRPHSEHAYLFFSTEELIDGCMGIYGKKAILAGLEWLSERGVISIHKNPNPRYHFDKTKYFQIHPDVCNQWIADQQRTITKKHQTHAPDIDQVIDSTDRALMPDREGENALPCGEKAPPSRQNARYIKNNTTNKTTNNLQSINAREEDEIDVALQDQTLSPFVNALLTMGMPRSKFYPDSLLRFAKLQQRGLTLETLEHAYAMAERVTQQKGFGLNYLCDVVDDLLAKNQRSYQSNHSKNTVSHAPTDSLSDFSNTRYETHIPKHMTWAQGE